MGSKVKLSGKKKGLFSIAALLLLILVAYKLGAGEVLQGRFRVVPSTTNLALTQAEALEMLVIDALGSEHLTNRGSTACPFSAFTGTESYASYYYTACEKGWISGNVLVGEVDPMGYYTKAEISKIAYKAYSVVDYSPSSSSYSDVDFSSKYYKYIESLNHAGAYSTTSGTFGPNDTVTKAFMLYMTAHM